jgi:hypothetical protein
MRSLKKSRSARAYAVVPAGEGGCALIDIPRRSFANSGKSPQLEAVDRERRSIRLRLLREGRRLIACSGHERSEYCLKRIAFGRNLIKLCGTTVHFLAQMETSLKPARWRRSIRGIAWSCILVISSSACCADNLSYGKFDLCVAPSLPACVENADTYEQAEKLAECQRQTNALVAVTTAYRACMQRKMGSTISRINNLLDRFNCLAQHRNPCPAPLD